MSGPAGPIAFIDLQAQRRRLGDRIDRAIARVLDHGKFILGPEVAELEAKLAAYTGARHVVTCGNGTDALALVMAAEEIGPGDAVFVPSFTFVASAEIVPARGATPVFVDVLAGTFNIDPISLREAIEEARDRGLKPRMVIVVDLFGQPADYPAIAAIAEKNGLVVVADAAQSFGASLLGQKVGSWGHYATTSFFPAKPFGCYGDGGAIFTDDADKAALLRSLRVHGQGSDKYDNVRIGVNSRLDTIQAAILIEKLAILDEEIAARQRVADRYGAALTNRATVPSVIAGGTSVWAQYTLLLDDRDRVAAALRSAGIPTMVYYSIPMHRQSGYRTYPTAPGVLPVSDDLSARALSLPMHPYLDEATQDRIIAAVRDAA